MENKRFGKFEAVEKEYRVYINFLKKDKQNWWIFSLRRYCIELLCGVSRDLKDEIWDGVESDMISKFEAQSMQSVTEIPITSPP